MENVGYSSQEIAAIKADLTHFVNVRDEVELGANEKIDMKQFEAGMRALLDTYIQADPVESVATFDKGLVQLIVERGAGAIDTLPPGIKNDPDAVAEVILNNVRKTIVDAHGLNPKYYERMSSLLDALIEQRRQAAIDYADFLARLLDLAADVGKSESGTTYPDWATTPARRALVDFDLPDAVDPEYLYDVIQNSKEHGWADGGANGIKERALARALRAAIPDGLDDDRLRALIVLIKGHDEYR
jgi:type I restriction enzyme R subunit